MQGPLTAADCRRRAEHGVSSYWLWICQYRSIVVWQRAWYQPRVCCRLLCRGIARQEEDDVVESGRLERSLREPRRCRRDLVCPVMTIRDRALLQACPISSDGASSKRASAACFVPCTVPNLDCLLRLGTPGTISDVMQRRTGCSDSLPPRWFALKTE